MAIIRKFYQINNQENRKKKDLNDDQIYGRKPEAEDLQPLIKVQTIDINGIQWSRVYLYGDGHFEHPTSPHSG